MRFLLGILTLTTMAFLKLAITFDPMLWYRLPYPLGHALAQLTGQ